MDSCFNVMFRSTVDGHAINYEEMRRGVPFTFDDNGYARHAPLIVENYYMPYALMAYSVRYY